MRLRRRQGDDDGGHQFRLPGKLLIKIDADGMAVRVSAIAPGVIMTTAITPGEARQLAVDMANVCMLAADIAERRAQELVDGT